MSFHWMTSVEFMKGKYVVHIANRVKYFINLAAASFWSEGTSTPVWIGMGETTDILLNGKNMAKMPFLG